MNLNVKLCMEADKPYPVPGAHQPTVIELVVVEKGTQSGMPSVIIHMRDNEGRAMAAEITWKQFGVAVIGMNQWATQVWPKDVDPDKFYMDLKRG